MAGLQLLGDTVWTAGPKLAPPGLLGEDAQAIITAVRSRRTAGPRLLLSSCAPPPVPAAAIASRVRSPCHRHAHCPPQPPGSCWHHRRTATRQQQQPIRTTRCSCRSGALGGPGDGDGYDPRGAGPGGSRVSLPDETPAPLRGRVVAFTTPAEYARRLEPVLAAAGATPLWCPTISVDFTPATDRNVAASLREEAPRAAGIAFTSRAGIRAVARAVSLAGSSGLPPADPGAPEPGSSDPSTTFVMAAMGSDLDLLRELAPVPAGVSPRRVRYLAPAEATPAALVTALGPGGGRRLLCPVPRVREPLAEPAVVPGFLGALRAAEWRPLRVDAYETRWAGPDAVAAKLVQEGDGGIRRVRCDAVVFSSAAEVEGMLRCAGVAAEEWNRWTARQGVVVAAHGPVTADGARRAGVRVDVVGERFASFAGVVDALAEHFAGGVGGSGAAVR